MGSSMWKYVSALLAAVLLGSTAHAQRSTSSPEHTAEIALSNDTMQLRYVGSGSKLGGEGSQFDGAFFLSEERDIVLSGGLGFPADLHLGSLSVLVGPKVYAALLKEENNDVLAMSVGAQLRFVLNEKLGLALAGHAYYAPDILTFGSADSLTDLGARVELDVAPEVTVFGGMRWFEFDLTEGGGKRTLQEELFVGFGYHF